MMRRMSPELGMIRRMVGPFLVVPEVLSESRGRGGVFGFARSRLNEILITTRWSEDVCSQVLIRQYLVKCCEYPVYDHISLFLYDSTPYEQVKMGNLSWPRSITV